MKKEAQARKTRPNLRWPRRPRIGIPPITPKTLNYADTQTETKIATDSALTPHRNISAQLAQSAQPSIIGSAMKILELD